MHVLGAMCPRPTLVRRCRPPGLYFCFCCTLVLPLLRLWLLGGAATEYNKQPFLRAVGILLLAALGTGGLHALTCNNLLRAAWPITFVDPWQVLCGLCTRTVILMCQRQECASLYISSTSAGSVGCLGVGLATFGLGGRGRMRGVGGTVALVLYRVVLPRSPVERSRRSCRALALSLFSQHARVFLFPLASLWFSGCVAGKGELSLPGRV